MYILNKGRNGYMDKALISIAAGDTGNQLVLKKEDNKPDPIIYHWNHETNKIKKWGKDFSYLINKANSRVDKIQKQIKKSKKKKS